jgi:hypothetical protein
MAKKRRGGRKAKKVIVLKSGTMTTFQGRKLSWDRIDPKARFFHEKGAPK